MIITLLTDSPFIMTGYSNQAKQLCKYFVDRGHTVHWLANGYQGKTIDYARLDDGTEIKAKIIGQIHHQYFSDQISNHLKQTKTDIFLIILDTFMLWHDPASPGPGWFMNVDTSPAKTIFWYPSDGGGGMPINCDQILRKVDRAVAYSKFAQKQVKDYYNLETPYIPLGTNTQEFTRLSDEEREKLRNEKYAHLGLQGKYVVGCVTRNQPRKFLDRQIRVFKRVAEACPDAVFLMHTDPNDRAQPFNLTNLIKKYNLENRVRFTGMNAMNSFGKDKMNEIYNLMDTFFLSTSGEGWGIPFVESMACEVPVVATDYTTTQEIVVDNGAGFGAKLVGTEPVNMFDMDMKEYDKLIDNGTTTGSWEVERGFCCADDAAKHILKLKDKELNKKMGKAGRIAAVEKYDMNNITAPKFMRLFEELLK